MAKDQKKYATTKALLNFIQIELGTDILVECFAELLIHGNLWHLDEVHIIPSKNHKRNYSNNVTDICSEEERLYPDREFEFDDRNLLKVFVSHNSTLDYLPETFYIDPYEEQESIHFENEEEYKKQRELRRKQKKEKLHSAIRFFRPLDIELYRARIVKELKEISLLKNFDGYLEDLWNIIALPENRTPAWKRFLKSLHLVSYVVGDAEKTKHLIEYVLNNEVELIFSMEDTVPLSQESEKAMNLPELGLNFSVGNQLYVYAKICTIQIKNLKKEEFYQFYTEGTSTSQLLKEIAKYYFPLDTEVRFDFVLEKERDAFVLGEPGKTAILGYFARI